MKLLVDLETGQRGFVITREERFLEPWNTARAAYPKEAQALADFVTDPAQARRAERLARDGISYIQDYSVPLVTAVRRHQASARSVAATAEGKRRVDSLRAEFARFTTTGRATVTTLQNRVDDAAERAILVATVGLGASIVLIALFAGLVVRAVVLPVRRAATMAGRLAGGDLAVRTPETATGEIGDLERAFNVMGSSLETSRDALRLLADEQAALRHVATLVARGLSPTEVFDAVAAEVGRLLRADSTRLLRYEADGTATDIGGRSEPGTRLPVGMRHTLEGESVAATVLRTGRPARMDTDEGAPGSIAALLRELGIRFSVGAPIVVEGRVWGVMVAAWQQDTALSADTAQRMAQFTELVATAIATANHRAELTASRARVVTTADDARRRLERDLHDGAQQRLTHTVITLKLAQRALGDAHGPAVELVGEALEHAERATAELRDLAHGILPAALNRGLRAGIDTLLSRVRLPVSIDVTAERLPPALEATAYFIVAEALTNVAKHAGASTAQVSAFVDHATLHLEVRDDGVGGARLAGGSGLLGLQDRAAAVNGELRVGSGAGGGTVITARLPIPSS